MNLKNIIGLVKEITDTKHTYRNYESYRDDLQNELYSNSDEYKPFQDRVAETVKTEFYTAMIWVIDAVTTSIRQDLTDEQYNEVRRKFITVFSKYKCEQETSRIIKAITEELIRN
ncbi:hypothetical protein KKH23_09235 [Patescibacteria group bacterium]|nr:hypothetical protein [Patescibacteria group bacterium]